MRTRDMTQLYGGPVRRVADVPEDELIAQIVRGMPQGEALVPTGDDAAVLPLSTPRVVVTVDVLVEGRHFRQDWSTGADVGWRGITQNAADVVAMGALPVSFVASLVLPGDTPAAWAIDVAHGMAEACRWLTAATGAACGVVGGDVSGGEQVSLSVTALGDLAGEAIVRSGARAGDVVVHTGTLGHSAAGLALLTAGWDGAEAAAHRCIETYKRPTPPVSVVLAASGLHSLMDVSDGLLRDTGRLARQSGIAIDLVDLEDLVDRDVREVAAILGRDPVPWVAGGGEDHGFVGTCAPDAVPEGFRVIGVVRDGDPRVTVRGRTPSGSTGWDHFSG